MDDVKLTPHMRKGAARDAAIQRHYRRTAPELPDNAATAANDARTRALWRASALAIGAWLEQNGSLDRPIRTLRIEELEGIAVAAVSAYQQFRQTEIAAENGNVGHIPEFDDKLEDLFR